MLQDRLRMLWALPLNIGDEKSVRSPFWKSLSVFRHPVQVSIYLSIQPFEYSRGCMRLKLAPRLLLARSGGRSCAHEGSGIWNKFYLYVDQDATVRHWRRRRDTIFSVRTSLLLPASSLTCYPSIGIGWCHIVFAALNAPIANAPGHIQMFTRMR